MMNLHFLLNRIWDTWMCLSSSTWATDAILALVCGLGLFILVVPYFRTKPSSPNMERKKNIRKHLVKNRWQKSVNKRHALKACRPNLSKLKDIRNKASCLQSHLLEAHGKDRPQQDFCHDASREASKPELASVQPTHRRWVEDPSRALSLSDSWDPGPQRPLPLASSLSSEHQENQADLSGTPSGTAPRSSRPPYSYLPSVITAISGPIGSHASIQCFSSRWPTARSLFIHSEACSKPEQELPPKHQPQALFQGEPTHRRVEPRDLSLFSSEVQRLLETLIIKRVELNRLGEKGNSTSILLPMTKGHVQDSQGTTLTSLRDKQDTTAQPIWNVNVKAEWLQGCPPLSYHSFLRDSLEQEYEQLFWGLPSLHSESLVATASVTNRSSYTRTTSFQFNGAHSNFSAQDQAEGPSQLTKTRALPPSLPQVQIQAQISCSTPNQIPSSPPHALACRSPCPMSQHKSQAFIPTEHENLDSTWKTLSKWQKAFAPKLQRAQEAVIQPPLNLTQGGLGTQTPKSASIRPEHGHTTKLQDQPEPPSVGSGGRHMEEEEQHQSTAQGQSCKEHRQPLGEFPGRGQEQEQEKPGAIHTTQSSTSACKSGEGGKGGLGHYNSLFQKDSSTYGGSDTHNMPLQGRERNLEDPLQRAGGTPQRAQGEKAEEESGTQSAERGNTRDEIHKNPEYKQHKETLQLHLGRKLGQAIEGMIPVCVRRSWLAANHAIPKSSVHTRPVIKAPFKGQEVGVNTTQELPFLDPKTRLLLEAHIKTYTLRHRMDPPSRDLEFTNVHLGGAQAMPLPCPAFSSPTSRGDVIAKGSSLSEEGPRNIPAQQVIKQLSLPTMQGPLHAVHSQGQSPCSGAPPGHNRESSETPTAPNSGLPSAHCSNVSLNKNQKRRINWETGRGSLKASSGPEMDRNNAQEHYRKTAVVDTSPDRRPRTTVGSQTPKAKGTRDIQVKEGCPAAQDVSVGARVRAISQTINANRASSESLSSSKRPSSTRESIFHKRGEPNRNAMCREVDIKVNIGGQNQRPNLAPGFPQKSHTVGPPRPDTVRPPQASLASSHSMPKSNTCPLRGPGNRMTLRKSSPEQQVPSMLTPQDSRKSDGGISAPPDKTADRRSFRPGWQKEKLAGLRPSQASEMSPPAQTEDTYDTENLLTRNLPDQGQAPPEGHREKRMMYFLQCLNPNTKNKKQEDVIQNVKDPSATAHDPVSNAAVQISNTGPAEAEMLKRVVGQVLVDTIERRHGSAPSELHWSKREPQQSERRRSSYQGSGCDPGQKTKVQRTASGQEASHKGHCHSSKSSGMRDRQVRPFYPGSQCHRLVTTSTGHGAQLA